MLLSRRAPASWRERARIALWPRRSWSRSLNYGWLRLKRVRAMPRSLALGVAAGVFVAVLPIPGVQLLAAAGLAWLIRGHRGAAALATFAANPITYPLIWLSSYLLGATLLGTPLSNAGHDFDTLSDLMAQPWAPAPIETGRAAWSVLRPIMATLLAGAVPLAALAALFAYAGTWHLLSRRSGRRVARTGLPPRRMPGSGRRGAPTPRVVTPAKRPTLDVAA